MDEYYSAYGPGLIASIDCSTDSVTRLFGVPASNAPQSFAVGPDGWTIAVAVSGYDSCGVALYDAASGARRGFVQFDESDCYALYWSANTDLVYAPLSNRCRVMVVDASTCRELGYLQVGYAPSCVTYSTRQRRLYIGHANSALVYVVADTGTALPVRQPVRDTILVGVALRRNPFSGGVTLSVTCCHDRSGELLVYTMAGRLVRHLAPASVRSGETGYRWDGRDEQGREAPAGVYLFAPAGMRSAGVLGVKLQ